MLKSVNIYNFYLLNRNIVLTPTYPKPETKEIIIQGSFDNI